MASDRDVSSRDAGRDLDDVARQGAQLAALLELHGDLIETLALGEALGLVTTRLGALFGLDRASIYLPGRGDGTVRLMATFEDPSIQGLEVDLRQYPELQLALASGETVFIPEPHREPSLIGAQLQLQARRVSAIIVVPILDDARVLGAILLRCDRRSPPLSEPDIRFCERVAGVVARVLRRTTTHEA